MLHHDHPAFSVSIFKSGNGSNPCDFLLRLAASHSSHNTWAECCIPLWSPSDIAHSESSGTSAARSCTSTKSVTLSICSTSKLWANRGFETPHEQIAKNVQNLRPCCNNLRSCTRRSLPNMQLPVPAALFKSSDCLAGCLPACLSIVCL